MQLIIDTDAVSEILSTSDFINDRINNANAEANLFHFIVTMSTLRFTRKEFFSDMGSYGGLCSNQVSDLYDSLINSEHIMTKGDKSMVCPKAIRPASTTLKHQMKILIDNYM